MTQVDFIISMAVILSVMSFSLFYTVGYHTGNLDVIREDTLLQKAKSLGSSIENSLSAEVSRMTIIAEENSGAPHDSTFSISGCSGASVYNSRMDLIGSSTDGSLSFEAFFDSGERRMFYVYCLGEPELGSVSGLDISVMTDKISALDETLCGSIDLTDEYEGENVSFAYFSAGGCESGSEPPSGVDVIARSFPVLVLKSDRTVVSESANVRVWK